MPKNILKNTKLLASQKNWAYCINTKNKKKLISIGDIKINMNLWYYEKKAFITWRIVNLEIKTDPVKRQQSASMLQIAINISYDDAHLHCLRNAHDRVTVICRQMINC